jgi:excisionase family DNA binding protein
MGRSSAFEERHAEVQTDDSTTESASSLQGSDADRPLRGVSLGVEALLTSKEASQVLKIHPKVLERMAMRGEVPALKVGKFWRYRATALDAWIKSRLESDRQPCRMKTSF